MDSIVDYSNKNKYKLIIDIKEYEITEKYNVKIYKLRTGAALK